MNASTLNELLELRAERQSDERLYTFLADGAGAPAHLSYCELATRARSIGARLRELAAPGARALLLLPPGLDLIGAFFGCLRAGVAAIPLPPPHPARLAVQKERLLAIISDARPLVVISNQEVKASLAPIETELRAAAGVDLRWLLLDEYSSGDEDVAPAGVTGETIAFLQYTSGSTARPKGVLVSHRNLLHNLDLIHRAFGHSAQSRGVIWLPPYHDMGLIGGVLQPLFGGFPVTLMSPASFLVRPLRWLQTVSDVGATTSGGPNFAYELCARKITDEQKKSLDLSSWQVAFAGAEPIRVETLDEFARAFAACGFRREAFLPCYGLAEATLFVSGFKQDAAPRVLSGEHRALVGCGTVPPDLDVRVVEMETRTAVADGEIGEVWVAGESVAEGYWNRPEETEETFGARIEGETGKTFLRTGDLGFFHDDELFLTGRCKNLIIIGGRNHFAEDIERTIQNASSLVGDCAAFSMQTDEGEQLGVALEIEKLARVEQSEQSAIIAAVRQDVAARHDVRAQEVFLVRAGKLPRTPSGKIQRHKCETVIRESPGREA